MRLKRLPAAGISASLAAATLSVNACRVPTETTRDILIDVQLSPPAAAVGEAIDVQVVATNGSARSIEIVIPDCASSWFYVVDTNGLPQGPVCGLSAGSAVLAVLRPGESRTWRTVIGPRDAAVSLVPGSYVGIAGVQPSSGERVERRIPFTISDSTTQ